MKFKNLSVVPATRQEVTAAKKGHAAFKRGEFVTLDRLIHDLDGRRSPRRKPTRGSAGGGSRPPH